MSAAGGGAAREKGGMRLVQNGLGVLAALVFIVASAAMNWVFLSGQGKTPLEAQIFGAVSVAADVLKALLPFYIASAVANRRLIHAAAGGGMFVFLLAFALFSALGFAAGNRGAVSGGREAMNARLAAVTAELGEVAARLKATETLRPASVIEAELARQRTDWRYSSSKECADATASKSREFCAEFFKLKGELGGASAAALLLERQATLRREQARLQEGGAGQESDPQAKLLSVLLAKIVPAADAGTMQVALAVMLAVLVELGAAFGLWLATGHGGVPRRERKVAPPDLTVARMGPVVEAVAVEARPPRARPVRRVREAEPVAVSEAAPAPAPPAAIEGPERFRLREAKALLAGEA